ncbi:hypothetical protein EN792_038025, partial [Mesorhizobium sp. M00.F.Ca.ET.149.01.1.1]
MSKDHVTEALIPVGTTQSRCRRYIQPLDSSIILGCPPPDWRRWPPGSGRRNHRARPLLSRRFPSVPTSIVTWFCAATAVLSLAC